MTADLLIAATIAITLFFVTAALSDISNTLRLWHEDWRNESGRKR
jgi:hypothetical protein